MSKSTKKTPVRAWDVNVHLTGVVNTKKYNTEYRYHCFVTCSHRRRLLVIGCLVLAITAVGASAVAAETREPLRTAGAQIEGTQTNATQIQHERPDAARRTGNASALERRLAGQLTDRLNQSVRRIDAGNYEAAQRVVADPYDEQLLLYMDVYRTAVTADAEQVEQRERLFTETAELQSRYAKTLVEYQRIQNEYLGARQADNRDRAQRRARELRSLSRELRQTDESLTVRYQLLSDTTDASVATSSQIITGTTEEISQQTNQFVQEVYTPTTLSADARATGSFSRPIRITGQLSAPEDAPPSGNATFLVNGRPHSGSIASDGSFVLRYRPMTAPAGSTSVPIAYAPDDAALYLPSSTTVATTITQESPTIAVRNATTTARRGSTVAVSGRITVDDVAVSNTSVALYLGERQVSETRTDGDAEYRLRTELPANISTGSQTFSIRTGDADTALASVSEARTFTVEETDTRLTLSAVRREGTVVVSGRLLTAEGTGVSRQDVSVSVNDGQQQAVQTGANGNYEVPFDIPQPAAEADSVPIQADFDGTGTNLNSASVSASLGQPGRSGLPGETTLIVVLLGGLVTISGGGYGLFRYRKRGAETDGPMPPDAIDPRAASPFDRPAVESENRIRRLEQIDEHLEDDDVQHAVRGLYGIVRSELDQDANTADTHWEFFQSVTDELAADQRSVLRDLTETFEAIQFADRDPNPEEVAVLRTEVEQLLADHDDGPAGKTSYTESHP